MCILVFTFWHDSKHDDAFCLAYQDGVSSPFLFCVVVFSCSHDGSHDGKHDDAFDLAYQIELHAAILDIYEKLTSMRL